MQPLASESARFSHPAGNPPAGTAGLDVLLVTADADLAAAAGRALTREGHRVRIAAHSGHALLAGLTARVDVLVAELSAPDLSGPALAVSLRKYHPGLRAVFLASPGTPEGLEHVIVRPFTRDDLLTRIALSSCLEQQAPSAS